MQTMAPTFVQPKAVRSNTAMLQVQVVDFPGRLLKRAHESFRSSAHALVPFYHKFEFGHDVLVGAFPGHGRHCKKRKKSALAAIRSAPLARCWDIATLLKTVALPDTSK